MRRGGCYWRDQGLLHLPQQVIQELLSRSVKPECLIRKLLLQSGSKEKKKGGVGWGKEIRVFVLVTKNRNTRKLQSTAQLLGSGAVWTASLPLVPDGHSCLPVPNKPGKYQRCPRPGSREHHTSDSPPIVLPSFETPNGRAAERTR